MLSFQVRFAKMTLTTVMALSMSSTGFARVDIDVMAKDLRTLNDNPSCCHLQPAAAPMIHVSAMCVGKNLRTVTNPLSFRSAVRTRLFLRGNLIDFAFPAVLTKIDMTHSGIFTEHPAALVGTNIASVAGARNNIYVYLRGITFDDLTAMGTADPYFRMTTIRNLYFTQQVWREGPPVASNEWRDDPTEGTSVATLIDRGRSLFGSLGRSVAGIGAAAFSFFGMNEPERAQAGSYVPPAPPPVYDNPGNDPAWFGAPPPPHWLGLLDSLRYAGDDAILNADYKIYWAPDMSKIMIDARFAGDRELCGWISPLMVFFDERRPSFLNYSAFPLFADGGNVTWPEPGSPGAFVAMDLNEDGRINDGTELFGGEENYRNGFTKLSAYDENRDGRISIADSGFRRLLLWNDANGDGVSQPAELRPLSREIESINLSYSSHATEERGYGASLRERSTFTYRNRAGRQKQGEIIDVWFSAPH